MTSSEKQKCFRQGLLKFEFYLMSLWLLFLLIIIIKLDVPTCFSDNCKFIGLTQLIDKNILPAISLLSLFLGCFFYFRFTERAKASSNLPVTINEIEDLNYEHLTFLTTYIVPLICFNLDSTRYIISLFLLLFVIGIIYVKTDKFYANPTLAVLGFRLYKINTAYGSQVIITKHRLAINDKVTFSKLDDKFVYGRKL